MTDEEIRKIENHRIVLIGKGDFANAIYEAIVEVGFKNILVCGNTSESISQQSADIAVDLEMSGATLMLIDKMPVVYPFDFIDGGAVMVVIPGDDINFDKVGDIRLWAARYMSGYCAFWHIENSEWIDLVLQRIEQGEHSSKAQNTAAYISARILANIAVGRDVKHFPRFYLSKNLE